MALLIVFLGYSFLMFQAGYQWRKWAGKAQSPLADGPRDSGTTWNGMIGKI